ncbi:MAG: hypothetical protein IJ547_02665, partial [Clostridia bacterium]|nr:hypothetical protein [Clostridia bacterium]
KHPLPAILAATSDENGVVTFDTTKNVTLTFLIDVIANLGMDTLAAVSGNNEALNALLFPIKLVMDPDAVSVDDLNVAALANLIDLIPAPENLGSSWDQIKTFIKNAAATGDTAIDGIFNFINGLVNWIPGVEINSKEMLWNTITSFVKNSKDTILGFLYDQLQNIGIVGDKISKGNYLLFEYKTPDAIHDEEGNVLEDYSRSPLIYTVNVDWKEPDNVYATVTDLGLIGPYIAPQFYDFVRNTQYEGIVAKSLGKQAWDYDFLSKLMTGRIALTEKTKQQIQGAFTAYMADALYDALGLNVIFNTRIALMEGMNDYLVAKSDTAKNLRTYVNAQAKKAKSVYAGTLTSLSAEVAEDDLWTFYTLDRSPTLTATKLINKSAENIAAAYPDVQKPYVEERGKIVSGLVNTVGTTIENTVKSVTDRIAEATRSVVERVVSGLRDGIKNLISGLLGNLGNLFGGASSTGTTSDEPSANAGA